MRSRFDHLRLVWPERAFSRPPRGTRRAMPVELQRPRLSAVAPREEGTEQEWRSILDQLGVEYSMSWIVHPDFQSVFLLAGSQQAIMLARDVSPYTLEHAAGWDQIIGPREWVGDLDEDVRVIIGLANGRFFGFRGGSRGVHASLGLYRCRSCREWWFLVEWGGWQCQVCGEGCGNARIEEQFTDVIDVTRRSR